MVICLEQGADLHMAQLMPLPLTVSCFSKIQSGFTFLVPAHLGSPGKRAVKRVCCDVYISPVMAWCNQICVESGDKSKATNLFMHACLGRGTYRLAFSRPLVASQTHFFLLSQQHQNTGALFWHLLLCVWPDYQRSQCHIRTCGKIAR